MTSPSQPGPLAEEAGRLAEALLERTRKLLGDARRAAESWREPATGTPTRQPPERSTGAGAGTGGAGGGGGDRGVWSDATAAPGVPDDGAGARGAADRGAADREPADRGAGPTSPVGHSPECRYCPLCQLIAVARGDRPEFADRLGAAVTTLSEAILAAAEALSGSVPQPRSAAPTGPAAEPPLRRVHTIDMDE